jgi:hypothetical protein
LYVVRHGLIVSMFRRCRVLCDRNALSLVSSQSPRKIKAVVLVQLSGKTAPQHVCRWMCALTYALRQKVPPFEITTASMSAAQKMTGMVVAAQKVTGMVVATTCTRY